MPAFEIPDSVKAYFANSATRSVVDALVSILDDPKFPDMDRGRLCGLNEGVVLACQVRADFVNFMAALWAHTFGVALEKQQLAEVFPEICTIKEIWNERHFWSYVSTGPDLDDHHFDLTVDIDDRSHEISLRVWRYNGDDELLGFPPRMRIPEGWQRGRDEDGSQRIEANTKVTVKALLEAPDDEVAKLRSAAEQVVKFVTDRLR